MLFGDGAGAVVLGALAPDDAAARHAGGAPAPGVLSVDLGGDPAGADVLEVPPVERTSHGRPRAVPAERPGPGRPRPPPRSSRAGATADDVDLFVPHQANARIIDAAAERLGIPPDRGRWSTSAELRQHVGGVDPARPRRGRRRRPPPPGDLVLLVGIGAGMAWAIAAACGGAA